MEDNKKDGDEKAIIPEVLEPDGNADASKFFKKKLFPSPKSETARKINLNPLSGILILFLDYAFFGAELEIVTIPIACLMGFILSFSGVFLIQKFIDEESTGRSIAKAFFGGIVTAIPTPISGTFFGSLILGISGLSFLGKFFGKITK